MGAPGSNQAHLACESCAAFARLTPPVAETRLVQRNPAPERSPRSPPVAACTSHGSRSQQRPRPRPRADAGADRRLARLDRPGERVTAERRPATLQATPPAVYVRRRPSLSKGWSRAMHDSRTAATRTCATTAPPPRSPSRRFSSSTGSRSSSNTSGSQFGSRESRVPRSARMVQSLRGELATVGHRHLSVHRRRRLDAAAHELGDGYADVLAEHRRVLREAFARHGGVEVDTQGDAFFVAFARASDALAAALRCAEALAVGPVRVRIGIAHRRAARRRTRATSGSTSTGPRGSPPPVTAARSCSRSRRASSPAGSAARPGHAPAQGPRRARAAVPARRR